MDLQENQESPSQVPSWSRHFASHDHIKPDCTSKVRFLFYPDSLRDLAMAFIFWTTHSHFAEFKVFELPHFPIWDMDRNPHSLNKMFGVLCIIPVIAHLTFMFDTWSPPLLWVDDPKWPYYIYIYIMYVCMYYICLRDFWSPNFQARRVKAWVASFRIWSWMPLAWTWRGSRLPGAWWAYPQGSNLAEIGEQRFFVFGGWIVSARYLMITFWNVRSISPKRETSSSPNTIYIIYTCWNVNRVHSHLSCGWKLQKCVGKRWLSTNRYLDRVQSMLGELSPAFKSQVEARGWRPWLTSNWTCREEKESGWSGLQFHIFHDRSRQVGLGEICSHGCIICGGFPVPPNEVSHPWKSLI